MCFALLAGSTLWVRGALERAEALWAGAEALRTRGIEPYRISGSWEWNCYNAAFDDYLTVTPPAHASVSDFLQRWSVARQRSADYAVTTTTVPHPEGPWERIGALTYRDALLRSREVYVLRRVGASP